MIVRAEILLARAPGGVVGAIVIGLGIGLVAAIAIRVFRRNAPPMAGEVGRTGTTERRSGMA